MITTITAKEIDMFHVLAQRITPRAASYAEVVAVFYDLEEAEAHALELNQKVFTPCFHWAEPVPQPEPSPLDDFNYAGSRHHY